MKGTTVPDYNERVVDTKTLTCSQLRRSRTGAKCEITPRGRFTLPIHSSMALILILICTARDLYGSVRVLTRVILHDTCLHMYFFLVSTRLKISPLCISAIK